MQDNIDYTKEQRLRAQQKFRRQIKQLFNNKQKKKENKRQYLNKKRPEAAQQVDIEHKQSQLLLQHQDRSHRVQPPPDILKTSKDEREEHLDLMMEDYKKDIGEDYIPFINMIDFNKPSFNHNLDQNNKSRQYYLQKQSALQQTSWQTSYSGNNSDSDNYNLGHHHHILKEEQEKERESEDTLTDISSLIAITIVTRHINVPMTQRHRPKASIIVTSLIKA